MANRAMRFCGHPGCGTLVGDGRYCDTHAPLHQFDHAEKRKQNDKRRKNAHDRGYNFRWSKYSKWFLRQPGNQFCKLHLDGGCAGIAQCVDHIRPHHGRSDPLFWDKDNHQAACIHCNSVKGTRVIRGSYVYGLEE